MYVPTFLWDAYLVLYDYILPKTSTIYALHAAEERS